MMSNDEIRGLSWHRLWEDGWFWRVLAAALVVGFVVGMGNFVLELSFRLAGFAGGLALGSAEGLTPAALVVIAWGLAALLVLLSVRFMLAACQTWGLSRLYLKVVRDDRERWFEESFVGFKCPFEAFWLISLQCLVISLWTLPFIVPGLIAALHYSMVWYVRADNPDWTARQCMDESARIMEGRKWSFVVFIFSYWKWLVALVALLVAGLSLVGLGCYVAFSNAYAWIVPVILLGLPIFLAFYAVAFVYGFHSSVGSAAFYCEISREASAADMPV